MRRAQNLHPLCLRGGLGKRLKRVRGWLHGNLPMSNLLTLLCWRLRDRGSLTRALFRNNKRTKLGYWTCGSHSSHFYNTMAKAPVTGTQVLCLLIFAIMSAIILLPLQLSLIYASINLKARLLPSHRFTSSPMELAPFRKIWQLKSAFMNMMYVVANLSQLGQVGAEIITFGKTSEDIWSPEQDTNTLISFPCALQPFPAFPEKPDSYWRWIKRALASLERVSSHLLSSWVSRPSVFLNIAPFTRLCIFPPY